MKNIKVLLASKMFGWKDKQECNNILYHVPSTTVGLRICKLKRIKKVLSFYPEVTVLSVSQIMMRKDRATEMHSIQGLWVVVLHVCVCACVWFIRFTLSPGFICVWDKHVSH